MPTKCIEYMAYKKIFLTTPISKDVVNNNDTGIVIRSDFSEKELIDNLIILILYGKYFFFSTHTNL